MPLMRAQATFTVLPKSLTFRAAAGQFSPINLNVVLTNPGSASATWETAVSSGAGGSWLALPLTTGTAASGNTTVQVQARPAGLEPGNYNGTLLFSLKGSTQPQATVAVTMVVDALAPVSGPVSINLNSTPPFGSLVEGRAEAQATLLADGRVLISGGWNLGVLATAELFTEGGLGAAARMITPRRRHTATLLATGDVLVAGGSIGGNPPAALADAEIYRGVSGTWVVAAPMREARYYHAAVLLPDKRLLVAGGTGTGNEPLGSTEIYSVTSGTWEVGPTLNVPRSQAALALLADGRVLITGGATTDGVRTATAELLDPTAAAPAWRLVKAMAGKRQQHTATLLPKGQVLVAGGWDGAALGSTEIYDPATDSWTAGPPLAIARYDHYASLLPAGVVFILGGWEADSGVAAGETELYNPAGGGVAGTLARAGAVTPRAYQAAALLANGQVLSAGGVTTLAGARLTSADVVSVEALQTTPAGRLALTPPAVNLSTSQSAVVRQTISLANSGIGTLTWTAALDRPWLSLDAAFGTAPATLVVSVNPAGLAPGVHPANVTLTSPEAANSPQVFPVKLEVLARPQMVLSTSSITVDTFAGVNPPPQVVVLTNAGGGTLNWTATSTAPWLVLDSFEGSAPSTVIVTLNTAGLRPGTYLGQITFTSREATSSPQTVTVTVRILPAPVIGLARSSLDFLALPGRDTDPQTITISNPSGTAVTWTAVTSQPWLAVSPSVGTAPGQVTIQIASAELPPGRYDGEVVFTAASASNSPRTLYVYLEVREGFEPRLSIPLEPGFYIVEATLDRGAPAGWWGMEVITSRGRAQGGFNLGGVLWEDANAPSFCAFNVPSRMRVTARLDAQVLPGGDSAVFGFQLRFRNSAGVTIGSPVNGKTQAELAADLSPDFYVAEARSNPGAPRATYQLGLVADNFVGGLATGGYLVPNLAGFGAFYLSEAQTVTIRLLGHASSGPWGAGDMVLTLKDAQRRVLRTVLR